METDPRVDTYIEEAPPFAQPILKETRKRLQKACGEAEETIKWNVPFFLLEGRLLASMAAFKKHVKIGVWTDSMPKFVDVSSIEELPTEKEFAAQLKAAMGHGATSGGVVPPASAPKAARSAAKKTSKAASAKSAKTSSAASKKKKKKKV